VASEIGLSEVKAELLPQDKVDYVQDMIHHRDFKKGSIAYVGDGINDAPVLALADVGIAMGGLGSDAAIEAADVVIMNDAPSKIVAAIGIAKHTKVIVKQNIVFSLGVKAIVLLLAALGFAGMWSAVFADVGVALIATLNALRAGR
ncbi:MAG: HAD hydrolase family protein, partial [Clostridiales Family XIII bacterium]|nr:HAD hydrolase family protein [Clostridiales Family XIII bacterium]